MPYLQLRREDYTVGWITALPSSELVASCYMLDEIHEPVRQKEGDNNSYHLGRIGRHNVVITCLLGGDGKVNAAIVARDLARSFPNICIRLMVGIGGGVPRLSSGRELYDIRLGDVVVAYPTGGYSGVVQYDLRKLTANPNRRVELKGWLDATPPALRGAIGSLRAADEGRPTRKLPNGFPRHLKSRGIEQNKNFQYPGSEYDTLYDGDTNTKINRRPRGYTHPIAFYGTIGSGDSVIKSARDRDTMAQDYDILCFEMEAAGLMNQFPCAVIRGVCDYADSHKNNMWQRYAATTAAAYAKELLSYIPPSESTVAPQNEPAAGQSTVTHQGNISSGGIGLYGTQTFSGSNITIGNTQNYGAR